MAKRTEETAVSHRVRRLRGVFKIQGLSWALCEAGNTEGGELVAASPYIHSSPFPAPVAFIQMLNMRL